MKRGGPRRYCGECSRKRRDQRYAIAKRLLAIGKTNTEIRHAARISGRTLAKLAKKMRADPHRNQDFMQKWDYDWCASICTMAAVKERDWKIKGGSRPPILRELAADYGLSEESFRQRLLRHKRRCKKKGVSIHYVLPPIPKRSCTKKGESQWDSNWMEAAIQLVDSHRIVGIPRGQQCAYKNAAAELGISCNALIGRIWRYRQKRKIESRNA